MRQFVDDHFAVLEVCPREGSVCNFGCFVIGKCRDFSILETPDTEPSSVDADLRFPFLIYLIPSDSLKTARISAVLRFVARIFLIGARTEIFYSIIQSISRLVVNHRLAGNVKDDVVHINRPPILSSVSAHSKFSSIRRCEPVPLIESLKIGGIYDGILSLRKWNQAVGWVKRLSDCVSFHAAFHRPSFKGLYSAAL